MQRESKIHYSELGEHGKRYAPPCGNDGRVTTAKEHVTCRVCWWHILADVAPWARGFLEDLRKGPGKPLTAAERATAGTGEIDPVLVPGTTAEAMDRKVKGLGNGFARAFGQKASPQKVVREFLTVRASGMGPIEEIVHGRRAPADAVGVQEGQIAEQAGDAGEISDEAFWGY